MLCVMFELSLHSALDYFRSAQGPWAAQNTVYSNSAPNVHFPFCTFFYMIGVCA